MNWLGEFAGQKSRWPNKRICSHCGAEVSVVYVYDDGRAFYCSEECLLKHFSAEEWNEYVDRTESPDALEPGLAYIADYSDRRW